VKLPVSADASPDEDYINANYITVQLLASVHLCTYENVYACLIMIAYGVNISCVAICSATNLVNLQHLRLFFAIKPKLVFDSFCLVI